MPKHKRKKKKHHTKTQEQPPERSAAAAAAAAAASTRNQLRSSVSNNNNTNHNQQQQAVAPPQPPKPNKPQDHIMQHELFFTSCRDLLLAKAMPAAATPKEKAAAAASGKRNEKKQLHKIKCQAQEAQHRASSLATTADIHGVSFAGRAFQYSYYHRLFVRRAALIYSLFERIFAVSAGPALATKEALAAAIKSTRPINNKLPTNSTVGGSIVGRSTVAAAAAATTTTATQDIDASASPHNTQQYQHQQRDTAAETTIVVVVSHGGGPGTDATGIVLAVHKAFAAAAAAEQTKQMDGEQGVTRQSATTPSPRLKLILLDKEPTWRRYTATLQTLFKPYGCDVSFRCYNIAEPLLIHAKPNEESPANSRNDDPYVYVPPSANHMLLEHIQGAVLHIFSYVVHETSALAEANDHRFYADLVLCSLKGTLFLFCDVQSHSRKAFGRVMRAMNQALNQRTWQQDEQRLRVVELPLPPRCEIECKSEICILQLQPETTTQHPEHSSERVVVAAPPSMPSWEDKARATAINASLPEPSPSAPSQVIDAAPYSTPTTACADASRGDRPRCDIGSVPAYRVAPTNPSYTAGPIRPSGAAPVAIQQKRKMHGIATTQSKTSIPSRENQDRKLETLWWAAANAQLDTVRLLLATHVPYNTTRFHDGRTALHIACDVGDDRIVQLLLSAGAGRAVTFDKRGYSALTLAALCPKGTRALQVLLDAKVSVQSKNKAHRTVLHILVLDVDDAASNATHARMIMTDGRAHVDAQDRCGNTALHLASTRCRSRDMIEALLEAGASAHALNKAGYTPLMEAVRCLSHTPSICSSMRGCIESLLRAREPADSSVNDVDATMSRTALHMAAQAGNLELTRLLVERG